MDDAPFLDAILAHPDEDGPRLVYADWLEEQGGAAAHERAEFIRLQCRLAAGECRPAERPALLARKRELLRRSGDEWAAPLRPYLTTNPNADVRYGWTFRRGFVEVIDCDAATFAYLGDQLLQRAPVRAVRLRPPLAPHLPDLAAAPALARMRGLDLSHCYLSEEDLAALLKSPHLTGLRELDLSYNRQLGDAAGQSLADSPVLSRLERLSLVRTGLTRDGLRALLRPGVTQQRAGVWSLRELHLAGNPLPTTGRGRAATAERKALFGRLVREVTADPDWERHLQRLLTLPVRRERPDPDIAGAVRAFFWDRREGIARSFEEYRRLRKEGRPNRAEDYLPPGAADRLAGAVLAWLRGLRSPAEKALTAAATDRELPGSVAARFVALCRRRARWWAGWLHGYLPADAVSSLTDLRGVTEALAAAEWLLDLADRAAARRPPRPHDAYGWFAPGRESEAGFLLGWLAEFVQEHHERSVS